MTNKTEKHNIAKKSNDNNIINLHKDHYKVSVYGIIKEIADNAKDTAIVSYAIRNSKESFKLLNALRKKDNMLKEEVKSLLDTCVESYVYGLSNEICNNPDFGCGYLNDMKVHFLNYVQDTAACVYYHISELVEKAFDGTLSVEDNVSNSGDYTLVYNTCQELRIILHTDICPCTYADAIGTINRANQIRDYCFSVARRSEIKYVLQFPQ